MSFVRALCAAVLGTGAAVLVSCGSSGAGLIPAQDAGPLLRDFQAVEAAAKAGNGNCAGTEAALTTTEGDYRALPSSLDAGLRARLEEGISHLHERALALCTNPLAQTTTTGTTSTTQPAAPPTATTEEPTTTGEQTSTTGTGASTTPGATTPSSTEGGTAPGVGDGEGQAGEDGSSGEGAKNGGGGASGGTGSGSGGAEQ